MSAYRAGGKLFPVASFPSRGAARGRRRTTLRGGPRWARTAVGAASRTRGRSRDQAQVLRRRQASLAGPITTAPYSCTVVQQRTANASSASDSTPTVASVRKPDSAARQEACFRSADFPMPGSPRKTSASLPWCRRSRSASRRSISAARPTRSRLGSLRLDALIETTATLRRQTPPCSEVLEVCSSV